MNEPTRAAENIARRILACEADEDDPPQSHAASRAVEKLHPYLKKYVGAAKESFTTKCVKDAVGN